MASSKPLPKGQIPVGCQVCETCNIDWKCETCCCLMCTKCKDKIHPKFGKDHRVINIKDLNKESLEKVIGFEVAKQHTVDIRHIHFMAVCEDGSLWIGGCYKGKGTIQHIKIKQEVRTLSTYNTKVYDMATSPSGSTYIVRKGSSILAIINPMTGQVIDSKFNVQPWVITCVHVTKDHSVIIGAWDGKDNGIVIVMNTEGKQIKKYEHDNQQQMSKYPQTITTTSQGIIVVCDRLGNKVVVLHPEGQVGYYHGHPDINSSDKPMVPISLLTTPSDNILVVDFTTAYLYILNSEGEIITYYNPKDYGIFMPYSLALTPSGNIYLGCVSSENDPEGSKAKLYELTFYGF